MYKPILTEKFIRALKSLGFVSVRSSGSHMILKHTKNELIITISTGERELRPVYVKAISEQILGAGLITKSALEKLLS